MNSRRSRRIQSPVRATFRPGIALLPMGLLALAGCGGEGSRAPAGETPIRVAAWTVQEEELENRREWVGAFEPLLALPVQAPREGMVREVMVRNGDRVQSGQVLGRLSAPDLDARRGAAAQRLAQLEEEQRRWERLMESGSAGAGELAAARLRTLDAQEQFAEIEALDHAYLLRAPATGRVRDLAITPGTQVAGGQHLMAVEDGATWGVRLLTPAWEAPLLEDLSRLFVRDASGQPMQVERISIGPDLHSGYIRVDLYVPESSGHRGSAEVTSLSAVRALVVPWTAVAGEGDHHWVALIVPGDPDRVERRTVVLGPAHQGGVEVLEGLSHGDRIVRYEPRSHPEGRAVIAVGPTS